MPYSVILLVEIIELAIGQDIHLVSRDTKSSGYIHCRMVDKQSVNISQAGLTIVEGNADQGMSVFFPGTIAYGV